MFRVTLLVVADGFGGGRAIFPAATVEACLRSDDHLNRNFLRVDLKVLPCGRQTVLA
jgi:hypothetical protein